MNHSITATNSITLTIGPNGESIMSSGDTWYRLLGAVCDVFLANDITFQEFNEQVENWAIDYRGGVTFQREFNCPAATQLMRLMILTCDEPDFTDDERRMRLRELMGR